MSAPWGKLREGARRGAVARRRAGLIGVVAAVAASLTVGALVTASPAAADAAAPVDRDGSASSLAAASCWAIKQAHPASPDGVYWLQTAELVAPKQIYCDQTTDGGGWALIGRGREGWTWAYAGQGSQATLRNTVTGPGAFAPAALPADTVQGLLGGGRVDGLADGVRVRRATNTAGTTWQDLRFTPSNRANWTWSLGGGVLFSGISVDGTALGAGNTQNWGTDQAYRRLVTSESAAHNYRMGFGYGTTVAGVNDPNSYLWQYAAEKSALAFSQVFIRPKIMTSTYPAIPSTGLAQSTLRPLMDSKTSPNTPWGVTGIVGGGTGELNMEVESFAQIGHTMYVGGKFQYVQKGPNPAPSEKIQQSYLAGFDIDTGEWLSSFRPVINGQVWDLQATPDGKLIVGGEFTSVNGAAGTTGIAAVDPTTGALVPGWTASVQYVTSTPNTPAQVKAIDYQDGYLYIGGRFNRVSGGVPNSGVITVGRAARLRVSDGRPDGTWKPNFDGSVIELDASDQGDRVYFSGYFNNVNGTASKNIGVVSTAAGAARVPGLAAWQPSIGSGTATYQQTIKESGSSVWQGGSEHVLTQYDRSNYQVLSSNITRSGGDFQAIGIVDGVVYASCHCGDYTYSGSSVMDWRNPIPTATDVNNIQYIGAWDAVTGKYLADFYPGALDTRSGIGPWELTPDSNGCLWFGGDMSRGSYQDTGYQWLGGFGKFCPRDTTAPTVPGSLQATSSATGATVSWTPSTDNSGTVSYEVLRDDRVVATTTSTSYVDASATYPAQYWVRAVDGTGNRSATTTGVTVQAPPTTLLAKGSSWKWIYDGTDPGPSWTSSTFDDSTWATGAAELGFGDGDEATVVAPTASKHPITAYFRTTVTVTDPSKYSQLLLSLIRDDGAVVYINGVEVGRDNMPAGPVAYDTGASTSITDRTQERTPVLLTAPASVLHAGVNDIAVEVHQYDVWSPDLSFDLQVQGVAG